MKPKRHAKEIIYFIPFGSFLRKPVESQPLLFYMVFIKPLLIYKKRKEMK